MMPPRDSVRLAPEGTGVIVTFDAPVATARLLRGKPVDQAVRLVGLVHNLCGEAHRAVARAACGLPMVEDPARPVIVEALREQLVFLCHRLPAFLGVAPVMLPVAPGRIDAAFATGAGEKPEVLWTMLFGAGAREDFSPERVMTRSAFAPLLAAIRNEEAARDLAGLDFGHEPQGEAHGPISGLILSHIREAHGLMQALGAADRSTFRPHLSGTGVARIRVARGTLVHRVEQQDGIITHYAIETPTDAMLRPEGPIMRALNLVAGRCPLDERLAHLVVMACNPCLPFFVTRGAAPERRLAHA